MLNFIVGFWFGRIRIRIGVAKKWTFFIVVIVFFTWLFVPRTILYIMWFSSLISWWSSDDQLGIKIFDNSPSDSDSSSSSSRSSSSESSSDLLASSSEETTAPIIFFSNSIPLYFNRFGRKKTDLYFYSSVFFQSFLFLSLAFGIFFLSLRFYRCHISFISYMDTILHHPTTTPTSQLLTIWTCSKRAANILHHTGYRAKLRYNSLLTIFQNTRGLFPDFTVYFVGSPVVWWLYMTSKRPKMTIFMICECDKTLAMASFEIRGDSRHGPQGRIRKCCIQSGRPDGSVHWATPYRRRTNHQPYHHHQQHQSHRTKNTTTKKPYSNKMLINGRT